MLFRKITEQLSNFYAAPHKKALLITGARQVGKTYIIREFAKANYEFFVEINFLEKEEARRMFADQTDSREIFLRLSAIADAPLQKGRTLIFFDEVQECRELVTAIKFLVEDGGYDYILSGSLLGVELKDIRSVPVGYMEILKMYPLDFYEFCIANKVSEDILENIRECFVSERAVDEVIHEKMMQLYRLYLIVGGMPDAVNTYLKTNNLKEVSDIQTGINQMYHMDIAKYDMANKLYLQEIFELIPSELNSKNKRFILKNLNENFKFSRYENSFIWLKDAGVALPVYCASAPEYPLLLSRATNLFKLFLSDVGLLAARYAGGLQIAILNQEKNLNFGAIYENAVAQELYAHELDVYYFNSKKMGELDFLIEYQGEILPIEVKSGKSYTKHSALNQVLENPLYHIPRAFVFCNGNVCRKDKVVYYPVYMVMFLEKEKLPSDMVYKLDLTELM